MVYYSVSNSYYLHHKTLRLKTFEFLADQLPFGFSYNFDNYLFNKIKHINTQGINKRADCFIVNNVKKRIEGKIHFLLKDEVAYSPFKSLFGSFEFNPRIHPNLLTEFWSFIESDLAEKEVNKVNIVNHAECYAPMKAELVKKTLENAGFYVTLKATNHHIEIGKSSLESNMHLMELRRLKKSKDLGFTFKEETKENAEEIYDFLEKCREEQSIQLSISKERFFEYLEEFPQNYPVFSVRNQDQLLAATIATRVHRNILYSYLPGSLRRFKQYSPSVMLNEGLYIYCQNHQIELLDLGISTEKDGTEQQSLAEFKERIGAIKSHKFFFEKML